MNVGTLFGAFVMPFKIQKLPFLLILSAHFVVTSQLEQEKLSMKNFIMGEEWDKSFPEQKGDASIELDIGRDDPMMSASLDGLKRSDCLSSCEIGSITRKQVFQIMPFESESQRSSKDVICVRKSCIPGADSIDNANEAEDDASLKNFLKDSGWETILSEHKNEPKDENKDKMHFAISLKHQMYQMKDSTGENKAGEDWETPYPPKHTTVFEPTHVDDRIFSKNLAENKITPKPGAKGHWMPWSLWSPCTTTCDVGVQSRKRICVPANLDCELKSVQKRICIARACHQGEQKSTLKILQGRDAKLRCYGRNMNMKHLGLVWITPYGLIIQSSNKTKTRFHAIGDVLYISSVQRIDSGVYHCIWPPFKTGTGLLLDVETCDTSPCKNNGNCLESFIDHSLLKKATCVCTRKYRGARCERVKSTPRKTGIIFIAIIVCTLLVIIIFLCCCLSVLGLPTL